MNKSDLIDAVADRLGGRALATQAIETFIETVSRAVSAGEKVAISGFGVFEKAERAARTGRNPATGAVVKIKKTSVPKFRPGTEFKAYVKGTKKFPKVAAATAPAKRATAPAKAPARAASTTKATAVRKTVAKAPAKTTAKAPVRKTTVAKAPVRKVAAARTTAAKSAAAKVAKAPVRKVAATKRTAKAPARKTTR